MPVKTPSSLPSLMLLWHQAWSSKSCDNLYIISAAPPQPTFKRGIEQDNLQKRCGFLVTHMWPQSQCYKFYGFFLGNYPLLVSTSVLVCFCCVNGA